MRILERLARSDGEQGAVGRHSVLLAALVTLLVMLPAFRHMPGGGMRFTILMYIVLSAAIFVTSTNRWIFVAAALVGIGAVIFRSIELASGSVFADRMASILGLGLLLFTTLFMLNTLMHTQKVSRDTVVGGICVYLLLGLCYAVLYILIGGADPLAFQEHGLPLSEAEATTEDRASTMVYFSFVTLTTLGYGDIIPMSEVARTLASSEAILGQLFVAIFIARLVSLQRD